MNLIFTRCNESNFADFYILKCDQENILWTGHNHAPDKDKLKSWYLSQLTRDERMMFIVKSEKCCNEPIGYLYLDIVGNNKDVIEIGHGVNSKFKGMGIGTEIIKFAVNYIIKNLFFIRRIDGWIAINNIGSIKNFLKNGFLETNNTKKYFFKGLDKDIVMKKFIYDIER